MNRKWTMGVAACLALGGCASNGTAPQLAQRTSAVMKASFANAGPQWVARLDQDEAQALCSATRNQPSPAERARLEAAQKASIVLPATGSLLGDWREGERIAQDGRGLQFSDKPGSPAGGNCYACHQLSPKEVAYGTIGPSLLHYGKLRGNSDEIVKYTYGKIYNAQAYTACSHMPRFGHNKILTEQQIKHVVALLLDPASPVNQPVAR